MRYERLGILILSVSDADAVQQAIADVAKDFGKIDVFIANAGRMQFLSRSALHR